MRAGRLDDRLEVWRAGILVPMSLAEIAFDAFRRKPSMRWDSIRRPLHQPNPRRRSREESVSRHLMTASFPGKPSDRLRRSKFCLSRNSLHLVSAKKSPQTQIRSRQTLLLEA